MPAEQPREAAMHVGYVNDKPLGYQQLTAAQLVSAQPLTFPAGAKIALLAPEVQGIRWRDDATNPTAAIGMPLAAGATFQYTGGPLGQSQLRIVAQNAGAILNVNYYAQDAA